MQVQYVCVCRHSESSHVGREGSCERALCSCDEFEVATGFEDESAKRERRLADLCERGLALMESAAVPGAPAAVAPLWVPFALSVVSGGACGLVAGLVLWLLGR